MTLTDLGILYALGGVVGVVLIRRRATPARRATLGSLALGFVLWPLWLPVVLTVERPLARPGASSETEAALVEGHQAVQGTPLESLLPRSALERMQQEVRRAAERCAELETLLADAAFDRVAALARLERLERQGASARVLASARSHFDNIERLRTLRDRDRAAIEELAELARALRTQLVLARYAGSSPDDAGDIVSEVWARLEVLDTAFDLQPLLNPTDRETDEHRETRLSGG